MSTTVSPESLDALRLEALGYPITRRQYRKSGSTTLVDVDASRLVIIDLDVLDSILVSAGYERDA